MLHQCTNKKDAFIRIQSLCMCNICTFLQFFFIKLSNIKCRRPYVPWIDML